MAEITFQQAIRLATLFSGAVRSQGIYPHGHPVLTNQQNELGGLLSDHLKDHNEIRIGISDGLFFVDIHPFVDPTPAIADLTARLIDQDIEGITISRHVNAEELGLFLKLLGERHLNREEVADRLTQAGITSIRMQILAERNPDDPDAMHLEATETYLSALDSIHSVFGEIENGRIPNSEQVVTVVHRLATLTIKNPTTLLGLAMIKDYDNYTFNHSVNVGILSMALAAYLGMPDDELEDIGMAGFLHDIGKTRVGKNILNKPGRLTPDEFSEVKKHPESGAKIISEMGGISPIVAQAVLGHHIRHNFMGYPEWARRLPFSPLREIVALADCYDAITTLRSYQAPLTPRAALDELQRLASIGMLEDRLVQKFTEMMGEYPVGTLVRLSNNEIAVVFRPNQADSTAPEVKVIMDVNGFKIDNPRPLRLGSGGGRGTYIIAILNPLHYNIDVGRYLS